MISGRVIYHYFPYRVDGMAEGVNELMVGTKSRQGVTWAITIKQQVMSDSVPHPGTLQLSCGTMEGVSLIFTFTLTKDALT